MVRLPRSRYFRAFYRTYSPRAESDSVLRDRSRWKPPSGVESPGLISRHHAENPRTRFVPSSRVAGRAELSDEGSVAAAYHRAWLGYA